MPRRRRDQIVLALALASIAGWLVGLGGAVRWGVCVGTSFALAAAAAAASSSRRFVSAPPLLVFLGVAAGLTLLQLIPLPAGLVSAIAPRTYELVAGGAAASGVAAPSWLPLSLDPPATLVELCKLTGYIALAFVALRAAEEPKHRYKLVAAIAAAGIACAVIALGHRAIGASSLFGVYRPQLVTTGLIGPLLNANHFAGLLAVTACLCIALAFRGRGIVRIAWASCTAVAVLVNLLLRSRGGLIAAVVGTIATVVMLLLARRSKRVGRPDDSTSMIPGAVIAACTLTLIIAFTISGLAAELSVTGSHELTDPGGKLAAWDSARALLSDHRWTGIGRGAFEAAFTRIHPASAEKTFSHVENEYLQAVVDWGILGAALLTVAATWCLVVGLRRVKASPLRAGAAGAVIAATLQNVADFGLELPGLAAPVVVLTAILTSTGLTAGKRTKHQGWGRPQQVRIAVIAAGAIVLILAASPLGRGARADNVDLLRAVTGAGSADAAFAATANAMARHPADYYAPAIGARNLFARSDKRAVALVNRALALHPTHADLHQLAARMLEAANRPAQACLEYRLALRYEKQPAPVVKHLLARTPARVDAVGCLPPEAPTASQMIDQIAAERPELALAYARRAAVAQPRDREILLRVGRLEMEHGDAAAAEVALREAEARAPSARGAMLLATRIAKDGRDAEAQLIIDDAIAAATTDLERLELLCWLADLHIERTRWKDARAILDRAMAVATRPAMRASVHARLARIERAVGNTHRAEWEEQQMRSLLERD